MKNEIAFAQALKETPTFKSFPIFKQGIIGRRSNILVLYDKYQQGVRYGIDYLKQNPNIFANDVKMISEVIENTL